MDFCSQFGCGEYALLMSSNNDQLSADEQFLQNVLVNKSEIVLGKVSYVLTCVYVVRELSQSMFTGQL